MDKTLIFKSNMSPISSLRRRSSCYNIQRAEERDRRKSSKFECACCFLPFKLYFIRVLNCSIFKFCEYESHFYFYIVVNRCYFSVPKDCWDKIISVITVLVWWFEACYPPATGKFTKP